MQNPHPLLRSLLTLTESRPDFVVLYDKGKAITAQVLYERSQTISCALASRGFGLNHTAVIATEPGMEFLEIIYAIMLLQGNIALIDPEMGRENYLSKIQQLQPQWMFIDSRLLFLQEHPGLKKLLRKLGRKIPSPAIFPGSKLVTVGRKLPIARSHVHLSTLQESPRYFTSTMQGTDASGTVIIYTSGTLSVPKGVVHTGASLDASITVLKNLLVNQPSATVAATLPHFMLLGITAGLPVKMKRKNMSAAESLQWLDKENIGVIFGPPSDFLPLINYCEQHNQKLPASLQHILIGSAPVHPVFLKRLIDRLAAHTLVTCTYGMTENLLVATVNGREKAEYKGPGDLVGCPVAGVRIKIEQDGEIMVHSPQQLCRYFHEEKASEWHASGDLGELDHRGNLVLYGRKKEMIIRRNMNIYPALYENTIKNMEGVEEAAIVGVYDDTLQDEKVYLALEGSSLNVSRIQSQLRSGRHSIDKEALPDHIFQMIIPRKGRQNKIDRYAVVDYIKKNVL
jgi:acyl-CoA synthetase (AMP-forming)/AMP-acid ligase II